MTDMREIVRRQELEARRQAALDSIPAVAPEDTAPGYDYSTHPDFVRGAIAIDRQYRPLSPDTDPEDTLARFDALHTNTLPWGDEAPPLTGPYARLPVEDQITESDARASKDLQIFFLGVLTGCCWAALVALVIL